MYENDSQVGRSPRRQATLLIGLTVMLGCMVVGGVWQFRSYQQTDDSTSAMVLARQYLADGRLDLAETALQVHLRRFPHSTEALEELRWLYFNQFRTREIEELLEAHLWQFPDDVAAAIELLNCEFRQQLPREGIGYLMDVNQRQPGQATVQLALGYCHWQIGELDTARIMLQAALSQRPDHCNTRYIVTEFLLENGETETAASLVADDERSMSVALNSTTKRDDERVWWLRSLIAEQLGDVDAAYHAIEQASSMRLGELRYVQREGLLLQRLGREEESTRKLQRANELEGFQSELSEIVLRGRHAEPSPELCQRLSTLLHELGRDVPAKCWQQFGSRLAALKRSP